MITLIEAFNRGGAHSPLNAALLEMAALAYPDEPIAFLADERHASVTLPLMRSDLKTRVRFVRIELPPEREPFCRRIRHDVRNMAAAFRHVGPSPGRPGNHLVLCDLAPSTLYALRWWIWRFPQAYRKIHVLLHSNAMDLAGWRASNPFHRIKQLRSAMLNIDCRTIAFTVLERAIVPELSPYVGRLSNPLSALPHPIPLAEAQRALPPAPPAPPLRIGFIGAATKERNFDRFVDLARRVRDRAPGAASFHAFGWRPRNEPEIDVSPLDTAPSPERLDRETYLAGVAGLHLICMPFVGTRFRLAASGAFLDAVAAGKPIIAVSTPTLEDLARSVGDIGYLCPDPESLADELVRLATAPFDQARYDEQVRAMARLRRQRSPDYLTKIYRDLRTAP